MCVHLQPKSRRDAAVGLRNTSPRLGVRSEQTGHSNVRSVLRHCVPNKGVPPLRCLCIYPSALCGGDGLLKAECFRRKVWKSHPASQTVY